MAFSLIDPTAGAVPVTALTKDRLPAGLEAAPARERRWVRSLGFAADAGKFALVPGGDGELARVLLGLGDQDDGAATMWALAGLPAALPEGSYRLDPVPAGADPTRMALGWALAGYAFTRYREQPASGCRAGLARRRRPRPRRSASPAPRFSPATSSTPRPAIWGRGNWRRRRCSVAETAGACHRVIVGDGAPRRELSDDPRGRPRQHTRRRGSSISSGATRPPPS